jgi:ATP-dependent Clp protease protease subunit
MTVHQFPQPRGSRALNYRMAAKGDSAEIFIYDIIGASWFGGISAQQFAQDLRALGAVKTIDLRINSDGGDVFDGRAIYTNLAQHPARVVAHVDGLAASIASLIAMSANEIRMADGSYMMIHNAWGVSIGGSDEMRRTADLLDSVSGSIAETYAARTKNDRAKIDQWMADETWFTAAEAVDANFADVLDEPVRAAASVRDPAMFRNLPAALQPNRVAASAAMTRLRAAIR